MVGADFEEVWLIDWAPGGLFEVAAGMEAAPGRHGNWTRYVAGEQGRSRLRLGDARNGGKQGLGIWVGGAVDAGLGGADFDDLAEVHDGDAMGDVGDDADVV